MMFLAKRLPVVPVPEELRISSVRDDMFKDRGFHELPLLPAFHTERMALEELLRCLPPLAPIASPSSRPHLSRMQGIMFITIFGPWRHQFRTAVMFARSVWFARHRFSFLVRQKRLGSSWLLGLSSSCQFIL